MWNAFAYTRLRWHRVIYGDNACREALVYHIYFLCFRTKAFARSTYGFVAHVLSTWRKTTLSIDWYLNELRIRDALHVLAILKRVLAVSILRDFPFGVCLFNYNKLLKNICVWCVSFLTTYLVCYLTLLLFLHKNNFCNFISIMRRIKKILWAYRINSITWAIAVVHTQHGTCVEKNIERRCSCTKNMVHCVPFGVKIHHSNRKKKIFD